MSQIKSIVPLLGRQKVIPVVVIEDEQQALGLSQALLDGGVTVIEITLRNQFGLRAIELVKSNFPQMLVIAGTVNSAAAVGRVRNAGADAIVSPGVTNAILEEVIKQNIPYLPGVATPSEVLQVMEMGFTECKLFPASVVGGVAALKAFSGPFPDIKFCPTGGISPSNYADYLALENVICVGGSWIAPGTLIRDHDWQGITGLCNTLTS